GGEDTGDKREGGGESEAVVLPPLPHSSLDVVPCSPAPQTDPAHVLAAPAHNPQAPPIPALAPSSAPTPAPTPIPEQAPELGTGALPPVPSALRASSRLAANGAEAGHRGEGRRG
ncbi:unnamed protein product, partial [Discosporangium mesarthrocarpum]